MIPKLPETYETRMKEMLGEEFEAYLKSFERPIYNGLRVNTRKISLDRFKELWNREMKPVSWCPTGYYAEDGWQSSHHPYYYAGLYYLQEPSAMSPAAILPIEPGDRVLDLCAAPGGKSTQLSARLNGEGVLVSNDISPSRAKALLKNLELAGAANSVIVTEAPYKLARKFEGFFTKILVDAPCSGEGMFHKEPSIMKNWAQYGTGYYADLQREILDHAASMLAPGGMLLYSTCTFSPEEDEQSVQDFLNKHPEYSLVPIPKVAGMEDGRPDWISGGDPTLKYCARLWPHKVEGQGHFVALFRKEGDPEVLYTDGIRNALGKDSSAFTKWCKENLTEDLEAVLPPQGTLRRIRDNVILDPLPDHQLDGLRVLRGGLLLGELKADRFEPSQAWAMALSMDQVKGAVSLSSEDPQVIRYLKGETLSGDFPKGWILFGVDGNSLGWGKGNGTTLKNKYLKGWRYL